jgi:hypothetical protein
MYSNNFILTLSVIIFSVFLITVKSLVKNKKLQDFVNEDENLYVISSNKNLINSESIVDNVETDNIRDVVISKDNGKVW